MPVKNPKKTTSEKKKELQKSVDLNQLAEKIVALLLREFEIEREREGR